MEVSIMIRYGELSTKGKNKKSFVQRLAHNVKKVLHDLPHIKVRPEYDYMHVILNGEDEQIVLDRLKHVFGIQSYSPVYKVPKDLAEVERVIIELLAKKDLTNKTFKIATKRSDHQFYMDTNQLNYHLGEVVLNAYPELRVQVKQPDIQVKVEVRLEAIYISTETILGAGGLPVGTGGRGMLMLSGGIDSPVAGYLSMKRGLEIEMVHFYSPPYTSPQSLQKTQALTQKLAKYTGAIQFLEVPFTRIQEEIKKHVPDNYLMTITRRMMLRVADALKEQREGLVIINGESMGQVASQTLHSMVAINEVTHTPIIRPVVALDKLDIIAIAEKIDTFNLSIQPFEDCCTVFAPPSPKTKPKLEKVYAYEQKLAIAELVADAVNRTRVYPIDVTSTLVPEESSLDDLL